MSALTEFRDHARRMAGLSATPAGEAALWFRLADEVDEYLAGKAGLVVDLFGEETPEPESEVPC